MGSPTQTESFDPSLAEPPQPSYVLIYGTRQDTFLDPCLPSRITKVTFEVLPPSHTAPDPPTNSDFNPDLSNIPQVDRAILSPSAVRYLLNRYNLIIKPRYDILDSDLSIYGGDNLKKIEGNQKFQTLMACGIAAAFESYRNPNWKVFSHVCRNWASELIAPILSAGDESSLTAVLLLLIHELAEPSRGMTWELLDLAVRLCIQLGWHRAPTMSINTIGSVGSVDSRQFSISGSGEARLLSALRDIEGYVQVFYLKRVAAEQL